MNIPSYIIDTIFSIQKNNFEAYIVGGCVRDLLIDRPIVDWDITTNATPEEVLNIFSNAKYENNFGTVLLPIKNGKELQDVLEITTYRSEQGYSDRRHPDEIKFETSLDKDLERRDFTINSLALDPINSDNIIDLFGGQKDIKKKIIRAVGEPIDRFKEDALRMIRAIRFSAQLDFTIEDKTKRGISKMAGSIKFVSKERIKDELIKILKSDQAYQGVNLLHETKLLQYIIPELEVGDKVSQDRHHIYNVLKHNLLALKYCPSSDWRVRFASLLHDIGKPKAKKKIKGVFTFYNHEYVGARMTEKIMSRLKFSNDDKNKVVNLVRNHMFYYNTEEVTAASVRRLIVKVGRDNLKDLIDLRVADRLGSGIPKAKPYRLRHLEYMMEKVQNDPISVKMLKLNGDDIIKLLDISPGPKVGAILDVLLSEIIEDPKLNTKQYLKNRAKKLNILKLENIRIEAKDIIKEKKQLEDRKIKKQYKV